MYIIYLYKYENWQVSINYSIINCCVFYSCQIDYFLQIITLITYIYYSRTVYIPKQKYFFLIFTWITVTYMKNGVRLLAITILDTRFIRKVEWLIYFWEYSTHIIKHFEPRCTSRNLLEFHQNRYDICDII